MDHWIFAVRCDRMAALGARSPCPCDQCGSFHCALPFISVRHDEHCRAGFIVLSSAHSRTRIVERRAHSYSARHWACGHVDRGHPRGDIILPGRKPSILAGWGFFAGTGVEGCWLGDLCSLGLRRALLVPGIPGCANLWGRRLRMGDPLHDVSHPRSYCSSGRAELSPSEWRSVVTRCGCGTGRHLGVPRQ